MTAPERETAGAVRSAAVAHFLPSDWTRVAARTSASLERLDRTLGAPQLLILVPDASAAVALATAMALLPAAADARIIAITGPGRGRRLLEAAPAHVVIGAPAAVAPLVGSSTLKLDALKTLVFAAADELDAEAPEMAALLAEVPKGASRLLTALQPTTGVEALIERYMHRARRVVEDVEPAEDAPRATAVRFLTTGGDPVAAVAGILDELDPPSAVLIAPDEVVAARAKSALASLGYPTDHPLAHVSLGEVAENTALVLFLGVPTATVFSGAVAAGPAQMIAVIPPRELAALRLLAGELALAPFAGKTAIHKARAADARMRAEIRSVLVEGIPSREILALEPLLGEADPLEIAAAALRLLEATRALQSELVAQTERRVRTQMKEAQAAKEALEGASERPMSRGPRPDGPPRGPRGDGPPRGPRPDGPRGPRPGGPPRSFSRDDGPRGPRRDDSRGPRSDGPRGPRRDDSRGGPPRRDDSRGGPPRRDDARGGPRGPRGPR